MSQVQQLIAAITQTQRQVQEQIMRIDGFNKENEQRIAQVTTALQGSQKGYDIKLRSNLALVKSELDKSRAMLEQASVALTRVSQL